MKFRFSHFLTRTPALNKLLHGIFWSYLGQILMIGLRFASSMAITRLLAPEAFGIFGPALAVIFLLEFLSDVGLRQAVGRSENGENPEFVGTIWTALLIRSGILASVTIGLAYVLPQWYHTPEIGTALLILAVRPILLSLGNPMVLVQYRQVNYRGPFWLDMTQTIAGIVFTISLAAIYRSYWCLAVGLLAGDVCRTILSHIILPAAPRFRWDRRSWQEISHIGWPIFFNTCLYGAWINLERLLGPRFIDTQTVGYFFAAWTLYEVVDNFLNRAGDVLFSVTARKERDQSARILMRVSSLIARVGVPILSVAAIIAPWFYYQLYPTQYRQAGILLGVLSARLPIRALIQVQVVHLVTSHRVILASWSYLISLLVGVIILKPLILAHGVLGMAFCAVIATYTLGLSQTILLIYEKEMRIGPFLVALGWSLLAAAIILTVY